KEYYYDYPASAPLARMINISPNLAFPGESTYQYTPGSAHYTWLVNAIDSARSAGIPWVVVTMHENCIKAGSAAGSTNCEIGADLQKLLVAKRVDLVLQGHTHTYQRSKQLALGPACSTVINTAYDPDCVVNDGSSGSYTKGAGMVLVISGTGGESTGSVSTSDPDAKYFAKLSGSNYGFVKFQVTATQLSARFVAATGTFSDSFTIAGPAGNQPPVASGASVSTPPDVAVPVTLQATDPDTCELSFAVVTPPAHGSLSSPAGQSCTPGSPNRDRAGVTYTPDAGFTGADSFTFRANDGTADSNTATVDVTVAPPPPDQPPTAADGSGSTAAGAGVAVTLQASDPDTCELSFSVVGPPAHGSLSSPADRPCTAGSPNQDGAQVTYTPADGYTGPDSFTFKANDGTLDSGPATVSLSVTDAPPPPAGITVRSASSAQNPTATTLSIPRPAGVVAGDVMVAGVGIRGAPAVTAPAGWTLIRRDVAGTYTTQALYYRVVTAGEPASYLWSFSASVPAAGGIAAYQGVDTATPVDVSVGAGQNVNTTSIVAPSVTTTVPGTRVVGFFSIGGTNSISPPAGMTERAEASSTAGSNHVT